MRFHVGFSFRLKTLKKFLFPILIGILAYFGFGWLFGCLKVNALVNSNTFYRFDVDNSDFTIYDSSYFNDMTYKEVLEYFATYNSEYFNIVVWSYIPTAEVYLNLYPKDFTLHKGIYGNSSGLTFYGGGSVSVRSYSAYIYKNTSSSIFDLDIYNSIKTCLDTNLCNNTSVSSGALSYVGNTNSSNRTFINFNESMYLDNDMSYNLSGFTLSNFLYYSQVPFVYDLSETAPNYYYGKSLYLNDKTYTTDVEIPSYINLFDDSYLNKNFDSIDKIYIGQINKDNINSLKLDLSFNYIDSNFIESLDPFITFYGRINHGSYFTYDNINCSVNNLMSFNIDSNRYLVNGSLFNGVNCSDSLSNYDNIYIYIQMRSNGSSIINNLSINNNYGNLKTFNSTMQNFQIYELFSNLNYNDSLVLSSNSFESLVYYLSSNSNTVLSPINKDDNINNNGRYNPLKFGLYNSTNAYIYNLPNGSTSDYSLELFFTDDSLVSLSSTDNHTYYDDSNTIVSGNIVKNNNINYSNSYNISYYFLQVSNFVESMSLSVNSFSSLLQSFYDSIPQFFQLFIFVSFILMCTYFTYLLIRK